MKKIIALGGISLLPSIALAAPWDALRGAIDAAQFVSPIVAWLVLVIALGVVIVSVLALKKKKSRRLTFVSIAFGLFFLKTIFNLVDLYVSPGFFMNVGVQSVFDLVIIGALFTALFKK
ncbi:MAG: hypothetical protein HON47_01195 [Candidatus Diapherotrites archaeon]|uniref:Uncharacterized protein n=1 Tax=Candidatus Iainarchaeum sp. TaxID=3101447 RepID=A0A8T5GEB4_9ARCH|nr:hypothetical protein [Candidatus Diapherotrites archaeon]MBT7241673.1 hypothetical protein [Candidatus Diapherotrites archaeon]